MYHPYHVAIEHKDHSIGLYKDDKLVRVLKGHTHWVNNMIEFRDGRICSCSCDGTLRIWDMTTGESQELKGHTDWVYDVIELRDGRICSCSDDHTLRIWDMTTGQSQELKGHTDLVTNVIGLRDGRICSCSRDGTLRTWDLATGQSQVLKGHTNSILNVIELRDGRICSCSSDRTLRIWDVATGGTAANFNYYETYSSTIQFDGDFKLNPIPTCNILITRVGNVCTMRIEGFSSDTTVSAVDTLDSLTAIPAAFRPSVQIEINGLTVIENSINQQGLIRVLTSGTLQFLRGTVSGGILVPTGFNGAGANVGFLTFSISWLV